MSKKVIFNIIEKNKYDNEDNIKSYIKIIINKLIANEFAKIIN